MYFRYKDVPFGFSEAAMPQSRSVTLAVTGWTGSAAPYSQTVAVDGVLADEGAQLVQIVPTAASMDAWEAAGVKCAGQGDRKLTFTAKEKPGGSDTVTLTVEQMPAHSHGTTVLNWATSRFDIKINTAGFDIPYSSSAEAGATRSVGGSQPHENRPPTTHCASS